MLVLSRKPGEKVIIAGNIVVTVVDVERDKIRLGITAPPDVVILRGELLPPAPPAPAPSKES